MNDFKEYFFSKKNKNSDLTLPFIKASMINISGSIVAGLSSINTIDKQFLSETDKESFADEASSLAHSEDFIQEFSSTIKEPKKDETEDEFVKRAKKSMKQLLSKKFS